MNYFVFIITSLIILVSSVFLFLRHKVQANQKNKFDQNESNIKGCLDTDLQDSCSESEVIDQFSCTTEEDFDSDRWQFSGESCRGPECSDGSISDEESLFEIALPGCRFVGYKEYKYEEEAKFCCRKRSPESVLWWPEMNEEENMIEIDLSVGSIKCSRFGIKA